MKKEQAGVCVIQAPCKINLHLRILGKRPDGFHNLESIFAALAFGDSLRFALAPEPGSRLSVNLETAPQSPGEEIPPGENLVLKALALFREKTGFDRGLDIRLDKRVPAGAGLGGGSSDAASTLMALDALAGTALPAGDLHALAASLGSDVPFFLTGGAAYVSGRGECIKPVPPPRGLWVLLVKPPSASGTASAYLMLDQARERGITVKKAEKTTENTLIRALDGDPAAWPFHNDFLPVFLDPCSAGPDRYLADFSPYEVVLSSLRGSGASFAGLSGSGSCCFGVFTSKEAAEKAGKRLSGGRNFIKLTFFLAERVGAVLQ